MFILPTLFIFPPFTLLEENNVLTLLNGKQCNRKNILGCRLKIFRVKVHSLLYKAIDILDFIAS